MTTSMHASCFSRHAVIAGAASSVIRCVMMKEGSITPHMLRPATPAVSLRVSLFNAVWRVSRCKPGASRLLMPSTWGNGTKSAALTCRAQGDHQRHRQATEEENVLASNRTSNRTEYREGLEPRVCRDPGAFASRPPQRCNQSSDREHA